jgi:hypothetical protein
MVGELLAGETTVNEMWIVEAVAHHTAFSLAQGGHKGGIDDAAQTSWP